MNELTDRTKELTKEAATFAKDAAYIAVGLGVLGFQRLQAERVNLQKRVPAASSASSTSSSAWPWARSSPRSSRSRTSCPPTPARSRARPTPRSASCAAR
jgi:hypothetical protein